MRTLASRGSTDTAWKCTLTLWLVSQAIAAHLVSSTTPGDYWSASAHVAAIVALASLSASLLLCSYYVILTLAVCFRRTAVRGHTTGHDRPTYGGSIALLHTTMNDFSWHAALSCVEQDYREYHVFLCDDSTDGPCRAMVDSFHASFPGRTTILRRPQRLGFKAGNLNSALRAVGYRYDFFAVNDADGVIPKDFLSSAVTAFVHEDIGFVQCRQVAARPTRMFGRCLAATVDVYWSTVVPYSAESGFLMFYGHGGLVRTSVWRETAGFPEIVSEDLGFSTEARRLGYRGVFLERVNCAEDFPSSIGAFAIRQLKYCTGSCEHLRTKMGAFLRTPSIPWHEKCDRLLGAVVLIAPILWLVTLVSVLLCGGAVLSLSALGWTAAATSLAPLLPACAHMRRSPARLVLHVLTSIAVYALMAPVLAMGVARTIVTGTTTFPVTGDRAVTGR
jgi:cellulose synthase/poly-beta-1,6-N-acetylglucosamine synthase-like glycosyltransferase